MDAVVTGLGFKDIYYVSPFTYDYELASNKSTILNEDETNIGASISILNEFEIPVFNTQLQKSEFSITEKAFDKIGSPTTLATLEGIITATIRIYVIDYMIKTFSINANLNLNFEKNHTKIISKFLTQEILRGLSEQDTLFIPSTPLSPAFSYISSSFGISSFEQATINLPVLKCGILNLLQYS